jgi:serine/threonine protein kinase
LVTAAQRSADLLGKRLGNFRVERVLGRGRMGVVYLATDEILLRATALKVLSWVMPRAHDQNPEAWFLAEARSLARINHPHVIQIYTAAKLAGQCFIAMEFVDGAPAQAWIERQGPFSPERATEILIHAAGALHAAHTARVVHCDVKPENLLVAPNGTAKLGDFGMSRPLLHNESPAHPVRAGTPLYTAPELWRGGTASPATDIYALGATYFHLLTGRPPLEGKDIAGLRAAHLEAPVPDVQALAPHVPPQCGHIVRRCMAKSASDRYASAQVLGWEALGMLRK